MRGDGPRVWDADGREYLDFGGGIAVVALGHCHPAPLAAARAQLEQLWHVSNLYRTQPAEKLASLLSERFGGAQAFFCNSGAEAIEAALKYARKATGKPGVVALEGALPRADARARCLRPGSPRSGRRSSRSCRECGSCRRTTSRRCERAVGDDAGLVLLEPVLGEGGVIPLDPEFVAAAASLDALLCFDEIQTGVGRTGSFFAFEQLGVRPDLVTLAKGLGNGLPIGALLVADDAAGAFAPGDHGSTFGGNPVSCAAACAVVEAVDDELLANVVVQGAALAAGVAALPGVVEVRGRGLLLGAVVDRPAADVVSACRERGLLVLTAGRGRRAARAAAHDRRRRGGGSRSSLEPHMLLDSRIL